MVDVYGSYLAGVKRRILTQNGLGRHDNISPEELDGLGYLIDVTGNKPNNSFTEKVRYSVYQDFLKNRESIRVGPFGVESLGLPETEKIPEIEEVVEEFSEKRELSYSSSSIEGDLGKNIKYVGTYEKDYVMVSPLAESGEANTPSTGYQDFSSAMLASHEDSSDEIDYGDDDDDYDEDTGDNSEEELSEGEEDEIDYEDEDEIDYEDEDEIDYGDEEDDEIDYGDEEDDEIDYGDEDDDEIDYGDEDDDEIDYEDEDDDEIDYGDEDEDEIDYGDEEDDEIDYGDEDDDEIDYEDEDDDEIDYGDEDEIDYEDEDEIDYGDEDDDEIDYGDEDEIDYEDEDDDEIDYGDEGEDDDYSEPVSSSSQVYPSKSPVPSKPRKIKKSQKDIVTDNTLKIANSFVDIISNKIKGGVNIEE